MRGLVDVTVHYLTWLERDLGRASETFSFPDDVHTVEDVLDYLKGKGGPYEVFGRKHVIFASIDNEIVPHSRNLRNVRTISLFSPIVGG